MDATQSHKLLVKAMIVVCVLTLGWLCRRLVYDVVDEDAKAQGIYRHHVVFMRTVMVESDLDRQGTFNWQTRWSWTHPLVPGFDSSSTPTSEQGDVNRDGKWETWVQGFEKTQSQTITTYLFDTNLDGKADLSRVVTNGPSHQLDEEVRQMRGFGVLR